MQSSEKQGINLPQKFKVTITETLMLSVEVEAVSQDEAEQIVFDGWRKSRYILDADNFVDARFDAVALQDREVNSVYNRSSCDSIV